MDVRAVALEKALVETERVVRVIGWRAMLSHREREYEDDDTWLKSVELIVSAAIDAYEAERQRHGDVWVTQPKPQTSLDKRLDRISDWGMRSGEWPDATGLEDVLAEVNPKGDLDHLTAVAFATHALMGKGIPIPAAWREELGMGVPWST